MSRAGPCSADSCATCDPQDRTEPVLKGQTHTACADRLHAPASTSSAVATCSHQDMPSQPGPAHVGTDVSCTQPVLPLKAADNCTARGSLDIDSCGSNTQAVCQVASEPGGQLAAGASATGRSLSTCTAHAGSHHTPSGRPAALALQHAGYCQPGSASSPQLWPTALVPGTIEDQERLQQVYLCAGNWSNSSELQVHPTWSQYELQSLLMQQQQHGTLAQQPQADQPAAAAADLAYHAAVPTAVTHKAVPSPSAEAWDEGSVQLWLQQLAQQQTASADVGFVNLYGQEFLGCLPELAASDDGSGHDVPASMQPYIAALEAAAAARAAAAGARPPMP